MATSNYDGHSASWVAGYELGELRLFEKVHIDSWLLEQERIDREAWIWTQGTLFGCFLILATYVAGRLVG